jgi:diadenylate cyclase
MFDAVKLYLQTLRSAEAYGWSTILIEFLLIGAVVYSVLRFLQGTRGARLLKGLIVLLFAGFFAVNVLAVRFGWDRISVLYDTFAWAVLLTILVVFQPELRRGLMRLGEGRWLRRWARDVERIVTPLTHAVEMLSKSKIGAIIAVERDVPLGALTDNGVRLDARISADLIHTIFWPNSMLHDMGVVIQQDRITAAGVQFPLAESGTIDRRLGSRHRAAVGLSEETDALVIVVSEETGTIAIADRGNLIRPVPVESFAVELRERLFNPNLGAARAAPTPEPGPADAAPVPEPASPTAEKPAAPRRPPTPTRQEAKVTTK